MKKLLRKLTAVVSAAAAVTVGGIIGLSALAQGDGVQTVLDVGKGSIVITADNSVSGKDSSGNDVTATDPDGYIITGSTTSNTVTVSGTQNITLQNATIDLPEDSCVCAFDIGNGGDVTLTLKGVNTIKSGAECAGIDVIEGETLEITGTGSLTVTGGQYGAGIGTGMIRDVYYNSGSVVISGGSVWAIGGDYGATVGEGASYSTGAGDEGEDYSAGSFYPPTDKNGNYLYPCTIPNNSSETVYIDGVEFTPNIHSNSELAVHAYLTYVTHYINVGDKLYAATPDYSNSFEVNEVIVGSAFSITATSGELVYGKDYTYPADTGVLTILSDKAVTISGTTTTDTIVVASGVSANITLAGVNIDVSATSSPAFRIADDSEGNVTITLADGSVNTLKSGSGCAGLQKNGSEYNVGTLTIQGGANGTGTLTAEGNNGAGIGGGNNASASNITISGGTVTAVGLYGDGAGIGGGNYGNGSYITISGGSVKAQSSGNGAGIGGGGNHGNGSYITISGGSVTANSIDGASIGGGYGGSGSSITISGGSVEALSFGSGAGIGGGDEGNGSNITISGGSVTARSEKGDGIGGGKEGSAENIIISGGSVDANSNLGRRFTEPPHQRQRRKCVPPHNRRHKRDG